MSNVQETVKQHKPVWIAVYTEFAESGKLERKRIIDHANPKDRAWLGKHTYWAFRNERAVVTIPAKSKTDYPLDYED